jgi:hypothetical protein
MPDERRYTEEEVSEIFALAARAGSANLPARAEKEGLTLGELQDVGREAGLAPESVAQAAATLDRRSETLPRRTMLGAPVSVGRIVELPREPTDREWEYLVAEFRQTFDAKGRVNSLGGVREWSNGNLHAVLEQTKAGHRLRLATRKGNALEIGIMGSTFLFMSLIMLVAMVSKGKVGLELLFPSMFAALGGGAFVANALRLPRWANERERQMEHLAERARELMAGPPSAQPD